MSAHLLDPHIDPAVLATDFVPDGAAAHLLLAVIKQQDESLEHTEEEISQLEARLCDMRARRTSLGACQNVNKGFLAPVRRVPAEILGLIFCHIPRKVFSVTSTCIRRRDDPLSRSPLLLLQVCRRWRRIALSTPGAWVDLVISDYSTMDQCSIIQMWLRNSGALTIDLHIDFPWMQRRLPPPQTRKVMQLILEHLGHFRSIDGIFANDLLQELSSRVLPIDASSLQSFKVDDTLDEATWRRAELPEILRKSIQAPLLADIRFPHGAHWVESFSFRPTSLSHLVLHSTFYSLGPSPIDVIHNCHNILYLDVAFTANSKAPTIISDSRHLLAELKTLKITTEEDRADQTISLFLDSISAPAITTLSISRPLGCQQFSPLFYALCFVLGANAPLQRLHLRGGWSQSGCISFLSGLIHLDFLELGMSACDDVVQALIPDSSPSLWMCPRLSTLSMASRPAAGDALVRLVRGRKPTAGSNHGLLRVEITDYARFGVHNRAELAKICGDGFPKIHYR